MNIESELGAYLVTVEQLIDGGISFWLKNCHHIPILSPFALDILALPASEASADWVFSHCGDLTRGKRYWKVTFEQSVFLKVNRQQFQ